METSSFSLGNYCVESLGFSSLFSGPTTGSQCSCELLIKFIQQNKFDKNLTNLREIVSPAQTVNV